MLTHFIGEEEVSAYLADLAERLLDLGGDRPLCWCPIGPSGAVLAEKLLRVAPKLAEAVFITLVQYDREKRDVNLDSADPNAAIAGQRVLVLDSSVHSGSTMLSVVRHVSKFAPAAVSTYTLVLKRSSLFIPTYWGVTIEDHDRAYFLLQKLPNNRLNPKHPQCHLRRLSEEDLALPLVESGVPSLDRVTWGDRWYDMRSSDRDRSTYLLEVGTSVVGYVTFAFRLSALGDKSLIVDEVVVSEKHQKRGHASTLMRWAETVARQACCRELRLWAIENKLAMYRHLGYEEIAGEKEMLLDGERYVSMRKKVIYHTFEAFE